MLTTIVHPGPAKRTLLIPTVVFLIIDRKGDCKHKHTSVFLFLILEVAVNSTFPFTNQNITSQSAAAITWHLEQSSALKPVWRKGHLSLESIGRAVQPAANQSDAERRQGSET